MSQALPATRVVAVIGAGAMGAGIAQVAAQAGHTVRLLDAREGAAEQAIANIRKMFGKLADKGHGVEPLTHIRPIYCVQAVCLCLLAFASLLAVGITTLLRPYVER